MTTTSRFTEQLNDSPDQTSSDEKRPYPAAIIRPLKMEHDLQRRGTNKSPQRWKAKLQHQRSKQMLGQTAQAYERRRSVAKSIMEGHKTRRENRQRHEKQHKLKSRLIGAV